MILAAYKGHEAVVRALLKAGAEVEVTNSFGSTPLHIAAQNGHLDVISLLLEKKAKVDVKNKFGWSPIHLAAQNGEASVVESLVQVGADVNSAGKYGLTPLDMAAENGEVKVVEFLLAQKAQFDVKNKYDETPLYRAAQNGLLNIVKVLLQAGADVNVAVEGGWTPLHPAVQNDCLDVVQVLVKAGAEVDAKNTVGLTPLHIAAQNGREKVVNFLLQEGANIDAKDEYGWTPLHSAEENGYPTIVDLIRAYDFSGEYEWRQYLPRLRRSVRKYAYPESERQEDITEGLSSELELVEEKSASRMDIAGRVIPVFLHLISLPQRKRLAFAKLFHDKLSKISHENDLGVDILYIIGQTLVAKSKRIDPEITAKNFAKIIAALVILDEYEEKHRNPSNPFISSDIVRADAAKKISEAILDLADRGEKVISLKQIILNDRCTG